MSTNNTANTTLNNTAKLNNTSRPNNKTSNNKQTNNTPTKAVSLSITVADNQVDYKYIILLIVFVLLVGLIYTNTRGYLVRKTLRTLSIIENYNNIKSYDEDGTIMLKNMRISSAYNAVNRYRCLYDYQDTNILKGILRLGCRYIELNIFPKTFEYGSEPVINSGYKNGQWKLMINGNISLEDCIKVIRENAFTQLTNISGSPNHEDPLFIGLNLHTGHNLETLDKASEIIIEHLANRLLPPKYSYQYDENFQDIEINKLVGKVVLFSSPGFEGSKLEEIINASWIDDTQLGLRDTFINYFSDKSVKRVNRNNIEGFNDDSTIAEATDLYDNLINDALKKRKIIRISAKTINSYGFNEEYLRQHNKNGLTIVVPNEEGDIFPVNYDASVPWTMGCQFVAMNFQAIDGNIDKYVTEFRRQAIKSQ